MIPPKITLKLETRIARLKNLRYKRVAGVDLEIAETKEHFRKPPRGLRFKKAPVGTPWGKNWGSAWFRGRIRIPKACKGERVYFRMLTWGEMLLFVDGTPFAGMDHQHHEVLLTSSAQGGESLRIHVEAYAGHLIPGFHPHEEDPYYHQSLALESHPLPLALEASELLVERTQTAALFYDMDVLFRTAKCLDGTSMRRAAILDTLNEAIDKVPFHPESDDDLEAGARAARKCLASLLEQHNAPTTPHIGIVGHAHIDVAWMWPLGESIRKAARTFSTFLRLMEHYPELTFIQSQPKLIEMIEEHYPELLPEIRAAVKRGAWQPNGGMWVEADCNVTGGESLVRQFLEGHKMTMRHFGYRSDTLWLPDVFGYSAALPQIIKRCGIDNFVTNKLTWNDTNAFPYSTFIWQGIDGSEVFTHLLSCTMDGYNADMAPEHAKNTWDGVRLKEVQDSALGAVGFGDGGGGVTREIAERVRRMNDLEGCPKTSFVDVSAFVRRLREQRIERPRWEGEIYLEHHRGTFTSQARTKRYNRKLEFLLRDVELFSVMAMRHGHAYPSAELERHWRVLLTHQFHDILPGSSIRKVYEEAEAAYAAMEKDLAVLKEEALQAVAKAIAPPSAKGAPLAVANSLSWPRQDIFFVDGAGFRSACDTEGTPLVCQQVIDGSKKRLAVRVCVPPLSVTAISLRKTADQSPSPFHFTGKALATPHYKVRFDSAGRIASLVDKAAGRELVQPGKRLNALYTAEDVPVNHDAWDIDLFYRNQLRAEDALLSREVVADGPLFMVVRSTYRIGRASQLTQDMVFYADSRRIDFKTEVDWQETHVLLKAMFPLAIHAVSSRHEIQFGHLVRANHSNTPFDQAQFETCAHKWVDVSEGGYGAALLNDSKYGYDCLDKTLSITLLKSATHPDEAADKGRQEFTYALLPHCGEFSVEEVVREAYELNVPLSSVKPAAQGDGNAKTVEFCYVSNANVVVEAVKKAEDSGAIVLRLYEAGGSRGKVALKFDAPVSKVTECNLLEEDEAVLTVKDNAVTFEITPFEIRSFKVEFSDAGPPTGV